MILVSRNLLIMLLLLVFSSGCSVMSQRVRNEAMPSMPFYTLLQNGEQYVGRTVILGGYILETENKPNQTLIKVLQAPLAFGEEPRSRDKSQGRFIIVHDGFLDPEVYKKDRRITAAGIITGFEVQDIGMCPYSCLKIKSREIYLWPEYEYYPYYSPYYYGPYHHHYRYWRHYPYYGPPYGPYYYW